MAPARTRNDLSAEQQIGRMREEYPGFAVLHSTSWIVLWRGHLTPYARSYEVQLLYCAISLALANITANTVHVEIVHPILTRRPSQPDVPVPHIWPNYVMPTRPRLCLHTNAEWTAAMYVADTIVPWSIEWLAAYEGWRATGIWHAGGHGTERVNLQSSRRWWR
jgi:hypothetical protein